MAGTQQELERALRQIDDWIGSTGVRGAAAAVWHRGDVVVERYAGEGHPGMDVGPETLFPLASVTKPITAAVVMTLVDEGLLSIDEQAARFVPEFRQAVEGGNEERPHEALRRSITVRQILGHMAGLPEDLPAGTLRAREMPDLATITDALISVPLQHAPGSELLYSNAGYALLGRIVERVTGRNIWDVAMERLFEPMALHGIVARPGPALADRLTPADDARHAGTDYEAYNSPYWREMAIPWGGLFGTAADLARWAGSFLSGESVLSGASRRLMTTDSAGGVPGGVASMKVRWDPAHWGLGWEVKGSKRRHWTGDLTSPETFCHFGATGTLVWGDPVHDVALAVFGNRAIVHLWPFVPAARWSRLSNAVVAAVSR